MGWYFTRISTRSIKVLETPTYMKSPRDEPGEAGMNQIMDVL